MTLNMTIKSVDSRDVRYAIGGHYGNVEITEMHYGQGDPETLERPSVHVTLANGHWLEVYNFDVIEWMSKEVE